MSIVGKRTSFSFVLIHLSEKLVFRVFFLQKENVPLL